MVGFALAPDAVVATDVTHATDAPGTPSGKETGVELGGGPVVARGSANHPRVVDAVRDAADEADIDVQLQATGLRTGTDADAFYTSRGGIPSLNLGIPNRYMHTPVEVLDTDDLDAAADLLAAFALSADEQTFAVDV
jgi:endoglucanase